MLNVGGLTKFRDIHYYNSLQRTAKCDHAELVQVGLSTVDAGVTELLLQACGVPFKLNSAAELCTCTVVQASIPSPILQSCAHTVFHMTPHPTSYYFILGHQKIGAVFQLFENISSFIKSIPVPCHTQLTHLRGSPHVLPFSTSGNFQHEPLPSDTRASLCRREDRVSGKMELPCSL